MAQVQAVARVQAVPGVAESIPAAGHQDSRVVDVRRAAVPDAEVAAAPDMTVVTAQGMEAVKGPGKQLPRGAVAASDREQLRMQLERRGEKHMIALPRHAERENPASTPSPCGPQSKNCG
ncbi:hypothetical protein KQI65_12865 [bacterium]|nr:hypothetical protein [bacterium]